MRIKKPYPRYITWYLPLSGIKDPLFYYSKKIARRINKTEKIISKSPFRFVIEPVTKSYISLFYPLYREHIRSIHGTVHNIQKKLKNAIQKKIPYYAVSLYNGTTLIGGLIFSERSDRISSAYKVFPKHFPIKTPVSPTYIAEKQFIYYGIKKNKHYLLHGRDRNAFGKELSIGVAEFKMHIGCYPILSTYHSNKRFTSFIWDKKRDIYLLLYPKSGRKIKNALFLIASDNEENIRSRYPSLFKNHAPAITILHKNQM